MSACEKMDARFEQHNTTFHATRAFVRVAIFHPDTNTRSKLVNSRTHLHYPSQKQWLPVFVGYRNHRAEPVSVLRRAPTLTDEQRQQRVGIRALSLRPSTCRSARRRDTGEAKDRPYQVHPAVAGKARLQFSIRSNHWKTSKRCIWLHVAPIRMSPWMTDDDPIDRQCRRIVKKVKPQRTPEPVREVLEQDQRTHRFDLKSSTDSILGSVFTCPA